MGRAKEGTGAGWGDGERGWMGEARDTTCRKEVSMSLLTVFGLLPYNPPYSN